MKRVRDSHHTERAGVHAVAKNVHEEFDWIFREQEEDFGIDAQIEVVVDHRPSGKIIAAQIKSGASYFAEEETVGFVFRGNLADLDYWLNHDLPVIVILYDPNGQVAYWQHVTSERVTRFAEGWKILVPRSQRLEAAQADALESIASNNEYLRAVAAEMTCPHCGAALTSRGGDEILYEVFECGYELVDDYPECHCPFDPAFPKFEEYELEFLERGSGPQKRWFCSPLPQTGAAKKVRLGLGSGQTKEQAEQMMRVRHDRIFRNWKAERTRRNLKESFDD